MRPLWLWKTMWVFIIWSILFWCMCVFVCMCVSVFIFDKSTKRQVKFNDGLYGSFGSLMTFLQKFVNSFFFNLAFNSYFYFQMPEIKSYNRGIFAPVNETFYDFFNTNLEAVANIIRKWPNYGDLVAEKIVKYKEDVENSIVRLNFPNEGNPYNLLIHGDFHFKNMMFIKNGDEYTDLVFVSISKVLFFHFDSLRAYFRSIIKWVSIRAAQ